MSQADARPPFKIVPIKKVDVFRSLLAQLEEYLSSSGLQPGDRFGSERELAEQFQVSRVSVREALRSLEALGKIEIRRNAGSFVANPSATTVAKQFKGSLPADASFLQQLVDVRSAIELKVIQLVTVNPEANLSQVENLLARAEAEFQRTGRHDGSLDLRFEAALGRECGNALLAHFQQLVHELWIDAWSEVGVAPGQRETLHEEHRAILAALIDGDADRAIQLMTDHADRSLHPSDASRTRGRRKAVKPAVQQPNQDPTARVRRSKSST